MANPRQGDFAKPDCGNAGGRPASRLDVNKRANGLFPLCTSGCLGYAARCRSSDFLRPIPDWRRAFACPSGLSARPEAAAICGDFATFGSRGESPGDPAGSFGLRGQGRGLLIRGDAGQSAQGVSAAREPRADGPDRDIENRSDVFVTHSLKPDEQDNRPLRVGKLGDRALEIAQLEPSLPAAVRGPVTARIRSTRPPLLPARYAERG